jgi:uncharacterized protein
VTPYLDASVIVPVFVKEVGAVTVRDWLADLPSAVFISDFTAGEFASAISRRVRMAEFDAGLGQDLLASFDRWRAVVGAMTAIMPDDIAAAGVLVRQFELKLRLPDAIHLAACQRRGLRLATLDIGLADAARALGVAHIVPA